ncbi:MAG: thiamine pyrophosphate-dependent dehydrogenase E1 component subunit alpha [Allosphingosinicella sp.]|uniref:thiamine pyrophosphate-dependent dehydrogenase E1 component subunit alpha n=1 Tax=Allosphingosinicella sp. TaxID=2823234 RepID=UPI003938240E
MIAMLERMLLIRRVEEQLGDDSLAGRLPGNVHLYIGQEAIAVGVCANLDDDDYITSTHRAHGHFLAKGGSPEALIAEVYGKRTGACSGLGGSMHVADFAKGMLGANAVVGGGIGLAAGAALAAQNAGRSQVAVGFLGDGATSEGILSEVLNIASLWKLPLVLVCESNAYSGISATANVVAGDLVARAAAYGIASLAVDGNEVLAVWDAAREAVARARRGKGATFIDAKSYRLRGHIETEMGFLRSKYRRDEEIAAWALKDPIPALERRLVEDGQVTADQLESLRAGIESSVLAAVEAALAADPPDEAVLAPAIIGME